MEREVRYCTSEDGTSIAYCVEGEGPPLVICSAGWESFTSDTPVIDVYSPAWRGRTLIRYDIRGAGLSQRDATSYELEDMTCDLEAVVRSAGLDRFALWASTFSVAPAILFTVRHPEQVARLILMRAITRGSDVMARENLEALVHLVRTNWVMATQMLGDLGVRHTPEVGDEYARMFRENSGPEAVAQMLTDLYATLDVRDSLKNVACPTLIAHRKDDTMFPFVAAKHAAAVIPQARLLALSGGGQVGVGEDGQEAVRTMKEFLDEDPEARALRSTEPVSKTSSSAFRSVLFTDIVGHTEMMSRLGDERGRNVLREHERITREALTEYGGDEVKTMGDGFMASFGSVTKAVECAIALQRAFAERESDEALSVRAGINAGEPIEEDGDLFGATVILASRIAAKADGGEILVADTVRGLCSGKGFLFADRGEFVAKGFEDPVRLFDVRWRE